MQFFIAVCFMLVITRGNTQEHIRKARMAFANPTKIEKYPYVAYGGHCTASIIHEKYLLSAMHCYRGYNPNTVSFWVGVDDRNNLTAGVQHFAEAIFERTNSTPYAGYDDIALIRLTQPITFNSRAQPIKMDENLLLSPGEEVIVTGFGGTEFGGYSQELREGTFDLYLNMAAIWIKSTKYALKVGDSGAPAVVYRPDPHHCHPKPILIGTASVAFQSVINGTTTNNAFFAPLSPSSQFKHCTWLKEKSNNEIEC